MIIFAGGESTYLYQLVQDFFQQEYEYEYGSEDITQKTDKTFDMFFLYIQRAVTLVSSAGDPQNFIKKMKVC